MEKKKKETKQEEIVPGKKVLFFTVTSGAGHNAVTASVKAKFDERGCQTKTIDLFAHNEEITKKLSGRKRANGFKFPRLANFVWIRSKRRGKGLFDKLVGRIKDDIIPQINEFAPDIIISSHVSGQILTHVYGSEITKPFRDYFIITDYNAPPAMKPERGGDSFIVMPSEDFRKELEDAGYTGAQLLPFGIPVNDKFYSIQFRTDVLPKLELPNFDTEAPTVLVMGGGAGLGKIASIVKNLSRNPEIQIITVCGWNEELKNRIDKIVERNAKSKKPHARIYNHGYCTNVEEFMTISHFSVGKTGGVTATEAVAKGLQVVSLNKIPFPEFGSLKYLESKGLAKSVKNITQLEFYVALKPDERVKSDLLVRHSAEKIVNHALKE